MSVITDFPDFRHLMIAHSMEKALTSSVLNQFRENYMASDGTTTVPFSLFHRAISAVAKRMPSEIRAAYFSDNDLRLWFHSLDSGHRGLVDYTEVVETLAIAAAMRRHYTLFARGFTVRRWDGPSVSALVYVDAWRRLAVCSSSKSELLLYSPNGTYECRFDAHSAPILHCAFLRPLGRLCTSSCDRSVILWDHKKLAPFASILLEVPGSCVAYDTDADCILVARLDGAIQAVTRDLSATIFVSQSRHEDWIRDILFLDELRMIFTASVDRTVGFWSNDGVLVSRRAGHTRGVHFLAYCSAARLLFSAGKGKEILAWNPFSLLTTPLHALQGHDKEIAGIFSDVLNHCIISIDIGMLVVVWDALRFCIINSLHPLGGPSSGVGSGGANAARQLRTTVAPVRACCQNAATREVVVISDNIYRLSAIVAPLRPPKLGSRLLSLHYSSAFHLVICTTGHSIYMFAGDTGEVCRSFEMPFGPATSVVASSLCNLVFFTFAEDGRILCFPLSEGKYQMRSLVPKRVAQLFPSPIHWAFPTRDGIAFLSPSGAGTLMSTKMGRHDLHVGPLNSVTVPGPVTRALFSPSNNLVCLIHDQGKVTLWHALKASTQQLPTHEDQPAVDACFVERRNAVLVVYASKIDVYNCGSFVRVIQYDDVTKVLAPLRSTKSVRGIRRAGSIRAPTGMGDVPVIVSAAHCYDDVVACATSEPGQILLVDIASAVSRFFRSQTRCIVSLAASDMTSIHNTHFAVSQGQAPVTGRSKTVLHATDRRTNTPVVLKLHHNAEAHDREVQLRESLRETPFVIRFFSNWSSNTGLSPGTAPRGIVMEQGTPFREIRFKSSEETDFLILSLLHLLQAVQQCEYFIGNFRPQSMVKVGRAWKLCSVDSLLSIGAPAPIHCVAAYCPPELCARCLHETGPVPTTKAANIWSLGVIVYELVRGRPLIQCTSETATFQALRRLSEPEIAIFVNDTKSSILGHLIVKDCLKARPEDRADVAHLISEASIFGYVLKLQELNDHVSLASDEAMPLPPNLVTRVDAIVVHEDDPECAMGLPVPNVACITQVATSSADHLIMLADCDINGEGAVHLVDAWGGVFGFLPRPELGEDDAERWSWPHSASDTKRPAQPFVEDNECEVVELTSGGDVGDSSMKLLPLQTTPDMRPPFGWRDMSRDELVAAVQSSANTNASTIDDVVLHFVTNILKRAPFFRGGSITGDPLPLYAERPMIRMNPFQYAKLRSEATSAHEAKRSAAIRRKLNQDFGVRTTRSKSHSISASTESIPYAPPDEVSLLKKGSPTRRSKAREGDEDFFTSVIRNITPDPNLFIDSNAVKLMQEQFDANPQLEQEIDSEIKKRAPKNATPTSSPISVRRNASLPSIVLQKRKTTLPPRRTSSVLSLRHDSLSISM